jgi:hypothetical protein
MIQPDAFMPDDLIRSRNWAELTNEEKESLKEVATTEEEFRLLKMMLTTAAAQTEDIPEITPAVHQRLKMAFQTERKQTPRMAWWRYAAAAAVLLGIAGTVWLVNGKRTTDRPVAKKETVVLPVIKDSVIDAQSVETKDSNNYITPAKKTGIKTNQQKLTTEMPALTDKQPEIVKKEKGNNPDKTKMPPPVLVPQNPETTVAINTSLKENGDLLQLVTGVY